MEGEARQGIAAEHSDGEPPRQREDRTLSDGAREVVLSKGMVCKLEV